MVQSKMQIEIWSDVMCPFCYIGKRHFEAAMRKFSGRDRIEVIWKSFQLDPSIPEETNPNLTATQYLASRKGIGEQQVKMLHQQVEQMARTAGLEYHLDNTAVYNSFKVHRLIQLAKTKGLGDAAEEAFFRAHFTENKNLADLPVLTEIGKRIGLKEAEVQEALQNDLYADKVRQDIQEAGAIGVNGVPFFVFNRKYAISGAQPAEAFLQTLEKTFAEWKKDHPEATLEVSQGAVCTPNGECK